MADVRSTHHVCDDSRQEESLLSFMGTLLEPSQP